MSEPAAAPAAPEVKPDPAAPAAPANPPPKEQLDRESYASLQQDIGKKQVLKDLKAKFGTDDLDAIEQMLKKPPAKAEPDAAEKQRLADLEAENQRLKNENLESAFTQRIKDAIMPYAPKETFINTIVRDFKAEYELREHKGQEYVFKKGSDKVEIIDNQLATLSLFFKAMAANTDYASFFKTTAPSTPGHVTTGQQAAAGLTGEVIVTDAQLKDRAFVQAIKDSGQSGKFYATGKVDMDKLTPHLKKTT